MYCRQVTVQSHLKWVLSLCTVVLLGCSNVESADQFRLAPHYTDHMVLQMEPYSAVIWGFGDVGAEISLIFKGKVYTSMAAPVSFSESAVWKVVLDPTPPSGPFDITIKSSSKSMPTEVLYLKDVLFGDVWICSGQSNMAFNVPNAFNASEVLKDSYKYPNIRLLAIKEVESTVPFYNVTSFYEEWSLPSPATLGDAKSAYFLYFSAVCYMFGVELHQHLGYPIGLISDNWGGTSIQAWSSPDVINACPNSTFEGKPPENYTKFHSPHENNVLWNAMIHPLLNFTIKGAIWYQGEANTREPAEKYACLFPNMIKDWRAKWYEGTGGHTDPNFPFGFVQLCTSNVPFNDTSFPALRWAQTADMGFVPNNRMSNVFMAVAVDLPDPTSPYHAIHPRYKQDVAHRLALGAKALAYGETYVQFQGPFPEKVCSMTDNKILVSYGTQSITLKSTDVFEVCCGPSCDSEDMWIPVDVVQQQTSSSLMIGYDCNKYTVYQTGSSLRYIWQDMPCSFKDCAVYGAQSDLPGPPFKLPLEAKCV